MNEITVKKIRLNKIIDKILDLTTIFIVLSRFWIVCQITLYATFIIPSDSMTPQILPGDRVIVNKTIMGGRIFDFFSSEWNDRKVKRLPALGTLCRNDVIVFNFPYIGAWDKIEMNLKLYYMKRCIALPGDTVSIHNCRYIVNSDSLLGNIDEQLALRRSLLIGNQMRDTVGLNMCLPAFPLDSIMDWTIVNFGPLYIPRKGDTIKLTAENVCLYRRVIEWEQGKVIKTDHSYTLLDDSLVNEYTFQEDYCFTAGDHLVDSQDSRYWGLLPMKCVVGRVDRIVWSVNPVTHKVRWNRIGSRIK
jgi:signal peptidase I